MKIRGFVLILCLIILSGCNKSQPESTNKPDKKPIKVIDKKIPPLEKEKPAEERPAEESVEELEKININLDSEKKIKDYLIGDWISDKEHLSDYVFTASDMNCQMTIDENLNVDLSFYNRQTKESKASYKGKIKLDRYHAKADQAPDLISIDLGEADWPGGDFLFKHRSIYDGKIVMSLFFTGNGNCIFDLLADTDNFEYAPEEIILEKSTDKKSNLSPLKDSEFHAVFWGNGEDEQSVWMNQVKWTPTEEYDPDALYPTRMTLYEDPMPESVLYIIAKENLSYISYSNIFPGEVYYVKTDKNGQIIELEDAQYKEYIEIINEP